MQSKKNNQQPDNSTAENKSNINKLGSGPYDGLYFSKFDYKMRGNTCKNSLPLEISIEIIDSQIKGFIDNLGNSKNKNQYCRRQTITKSYFKNEIMRMSFPKAALVLIYNWER